MNLSTVQQETAAWPSCLSRQCLPRLCQRSTASHQNNTGTPGHKELGFLWSVLYIYSSWRFQEGHWKFNTTKPYGCTRIKYCQEKRNMANPEQSFKTSWVGSPQCTMRRLWNWWVVVWILALSFMNSVILSKGGISQNIGKESQGVLKMFFRTIPVVQEPILGDAPTGQ